MKEQNGVCAICKQEEELERLKSLSVDHCHDTDKIRGLLCRKCNLALGLFNDNIEILKNAINYLEEK